MSRARYMKAEVNGIIVGCLYLLNGNPAPGPKYDYKLRWLERFQARAEALLTLGNPVVLAGDNNIIPGEEDVYKPERWQDDALFRPEVRSAFSTLTNQGWVDALRRLYPNEAVYTFWDYFRNSFSRNAGLRIDHLLLSPQLESRPTAAGVDRDVRAWEKTSDLAPVWVELSDQ